MTAGGSGGGAWSFGYDRFGNMWVSGNSGLTLHVTTPTQQSQFNAATNRLTGTGVSYDAGGNLTAYPLLGTMTYDAENRQTQFTSGSTTVTYHYDGDGRRVKQVKGSETTVFVYDAFGNLAAEYTTASASGTAGRYYRTTDHLGSTRLVTNSTGAVVSRHDFVPFGEELAASSSAGNRNLVFGFGATSPARQKFTGKERDLDSNLDYFIARYYSSPMGRFTSADAPFADQFSENPQSWNLYSYTRNSPLSLTDPDGRAVPLILGCAANPACRGAVGAVLGAAASTVVYSAVTLARGEGLTREGLTAAAIQGAITTGTIATVGPAGGTLVATQPGLAAATGAALNLAAGEVARTATGQETGLAEVAADSLGGSLLPLSTSVGSSVTANATAGAVSAAASANATAAEVSTVFPTVGAQMARASSRQGKAGAAAAVVKGTIVDTGISSGTGGMFSKLFSSLFGGKKKEEEEH